ncbi:hypothetical protein D3105_13050 [Streptomyces globisporus]|uniref:Uncharacterized protein n=1 Tax=Streptomyces globisporus TaxID=1908 RepID=A0A423V0K3_STRGL|nr:hypothetical protein D3105_13050 [Streptomyces globisporus]
MRCCGGSWRTARWGEERSACGGLVPLPAPSRNRGAAPGPAPQTPEGLGGVALPRAPLLRRRRGWEGWRCPGPRSSDAGGAEDEVRRADRVGLTCCGFSSLLLRRPCPAVPSVRRR